MRAMKRVFLILAALFFAAAAGAQDAPEPADAAQERAQMAEKIHRLEAEIQNLRDASHAAIEGVQARLDDANLHLNRVLLIFAAAALLILLLAAHNIRLRQRDSARRMEESIRESQTLNRDLRRHLAAPEMQHLRVAQFLREIMRRLRDSDAAELSESQARMVREAAADMHVPAALHFMAVALRDEQSNDWEKAAAALNRLRDMDPDDPDILLHLAHVHGKLSEREPDPKIRARNRRLAHQYYTRFAMALRAMEMDDAVIPVRRTYIQIPQAPAPPAAPPQPLRFPEAKIPQPQTTPPPPPPNHRNRPRPRPRPDSDSVDADARTVHSAGRRAAGGKNQAEIPPAARTAAPFGHAVLFETGPQTRSPPPPPPRPSRPRSRPRSSSRKRKRRPLRKPNRRGPNPKPVPPLPPPPPLPRRRNRRPNQRRRPRPKAKPK